MFWIQFITSMWICLYPGRKLNQFGPDFSLSVTKKFNFSWKNVIMWVKHSYVCAKAFLKGWDQVYLLISLLLDLDPHSRFGSRSRRAKLIRIRSTFIFVLSTALFKFFLNLLPLSERWARNWRQTSRCKRWWQLLATRYSVKRNPI